MGNSGLAMTAEADSVAEPGTKVILSDTLPDGITYDVFLAECVSNSKNAEIVFELTMKSKEVEEDGPDDFTVKIISDGPKLKTYGFQDHERDQVVHWCRTQVNREKRVYENTYYKGGDLDMAGKDEVALYNCTTFLQDPLRIECFAKVNGERKTDEEAKQGFVNWANGILATMAKKKVAVKEADSPSGGGVKSAVSDPLDEYTDFDKLWDKLLEVMKKEGTLEGCELTEVSENEWNVKRVTKLADDKEFKMESNTKIDKAAKTLIYTVNMENSPPSVYYTKFHADPLRAEYYREIDGKRDVSVAFIKDMDLRLNALMTELEGEKSWFNW